MLKPINNKHSINRVEATIYTPQLLVKPNNIFKKIYDNNGFLTYQLRSPILAKALNITERNIEVKASETVGFIFEQFNDKGRSINSLKIENQQNRCVINFKNREYTDWQEFINRFKSDIIQLINYYPFYAEAIALEYTDEFIWASDSTINLENVFNNTNGYFSQKFLESFNGVQTILSQTDIADSNNYREEKTDIMVDNNLKRVFINHKYITKFNDAVSISEENFKELQISLEEAHSANKSLLREILTEQTQELISLN